MTSTGRWGAFVALTATVSFLVGLVVAGTRPPLPLNTFPVRPAPETAPVGVWSGEISTKAVSAPSPAGPVDFAEVATRVNAAVVNVDTASRGSDQTPRATRRFRADDPNAPREGSGSGFIIDPAGFILTNHHVVSGADRVTVTLSDGRLFRADVVGVDPAIDVALLRIHAREPLPVAQLGDSETLRVGEWVCAIGNPLGVYVHSVTVGVVSFIGRKLFDQGLDAFIQTDAAITLGNSGGPLINASGRVVGITTAISANASNIGFAIPIAQVVSVLPQLRTQGSVARGFIGVVVTELTPELRKALRLSAERGALVEDVNPDTPAERAGLRPYDVISAVDGRLIRTDEELTRYVSSRAPGSLVSLDVWRDDERFTLPVKLREREIAESIRRRLPREIDARPAAQDQAPLGLRVRDLDAETAGRLRIPESLQGVLVSDVDPAGPARLAQVRLNHVILEVNRRRVTSAKDYLAAVSLLRSGDVAALLIYDRTTRQRLISTVLPDSGP
jgi:serine protease Do